MGLRSRRSAAAETEEDDGDETIERAAAPQPQLTDAEKLAALAAENEALKAQLAAKGESDPPPPSGVYSRWRVSVQDAVTWVVEAPNYTHAFEAYKAATGLISTPHSPTIVATEEPLGRVKLR